MDVGFSSRPYIGRLLWGAVRGEKDDSRVAAGALDEDGQEGGDVVQPKLGRVRKYLGRHKGC